MEDKKVDLHYELAKKFCWHHLWFLQLLMIHQSGCLLFYLDPHFLRPYILLENIMSVESRRAMFAWVATYWDGGEFDIICDYKMTPINT